MFEQDDLYTIKEIAIETGAKPVTLYRKLKRHPEYTWLLQDGVIMVSGNVVKKLLIKEKRGPKEKILSEQSNEKPQQKGIEK